MNAEEKNVMTIVTLARIIENTLYYVLPRNEGSSFSYEERSQRCKALKALTSEGSPFQVNCDNNGDNGKKLKEDVEYFIEDVYEDPGRIVTVDINNNVHVESSLTLELFSTIVSLRFRLEAFINSAMKLLKEHNSLEESFAELVNTDIRFYHAFAGKISCILIANKFLELNKNANTYAENYSKSHNGANPNNDPEFNVRNDPSFRMLENEFHELNNDMLLIMNNYGENDSEFRHARDQVYSDCQIFTGKKQTTNLNAFFTMFTSYFDRIIQQTERPVNKMFQDVSKELTDDAMKAQEKGEEK